MCLWRWRATRLRGEVTDALQNLDKTEKECQYSRKCQTLWVPQLSWGISILFILAVTPVIKKEQCSCKPQNTGNRKIDSWRCKPQESCG